MYSTMQKQKLNKQELSVMVLGIFDLLKRILYSDFEKREKESGYLVVFNLDDMEISEAIGGVCSTAIEEKHKNLSMAAANYLRENPSLWTTLEDSKQLKSEAVGCIRIESLVIAFSSELDCYGDDTVVILSALLAGLLSPDSARLYADKSRNDLVEKIISFDKIGKIKRTQ